MQDILINWTPQETRVAVVENGAVQELHVERALERGLVGNVYLGKVARVQVAHGRSESDLVPDRAPLGNGGADRADAADYASGLRRRHGAVPVHRAVDMRQVTARSSVPRPDSCGP